MPSTTEAILGKDKIIRLLLCAGLALYWVIFLWSFWDNGIYTLGINAAVFLLLLIGVLVYTLYRRGHYTRADLIWIIPLFLIALSYGLYDNPFLKITSIPVIPAMVVIFYNQAFLADKGTRQWNTRFVFKIIERFFLFLTKISEGIRGYVHLVMPVEKSKKSVALRIIGGILLLLLIGVVVVIPLLSSADAIFAGKIHIVYDWSQRFLTLPGIYKVLVFAILAVGFYALLTAWSGRFEYSDTEDAVTQVDSIVTGIVLGGMLGLYVLFLWVQLQYLWIGSLPFDFSQTENIVKSGFWQLLGLSILNIAIYFFTYQKTNKLVQHILMAFSLASLLVLISAGYRMGLYVMYYGFSYEKFFASYTVVYCAVLFAWLISRLFVAHRANIVKVVIILFLWMYGLLVITPVEQIIVRTNVLLAQRSDSRIRLFEMTMLSPDVLRIINTYEQRGMLVENVGYLAREEVATTADQFDWQPWIEQQRQQISKKKWYEKNLNNLLH